MLERGRTPASSRQRHELDHVHGEISTEVLAEMPADIQDEVCCLFVCLSIYSIIFIDHITETDRTTKTELS